MNAKKVSCSFLFLAPSVVLGLCASVNPAGAQEAVKVDLQKQASDLVGAFEKAYKAVAGASVVDLRSGGTVVSIRDGEQMIPASNQKLLTGAAAIAKLGGDFKFTTTVYLGGKDLAVAGEGDPTLGDPLLAQEAGKSIYEELDKWAAAVKAKVGTKLEGDILLCSDRETFRHADWPKAQHDRWYAAPVAELNFNNNCFDVTFRTRDGALVPVVLPESRFIQVVNRIQKGAKHLWSLRASADESVITLTGTASQSTRDPLSVAVNDPPMLLGRVLADRIVRAGVEFSGRVRRVKPSTVDLAKAQVLCQTATPLATVLKRANKRSLNMVAECVFLRTGDGTWPGSAKIVTETLVKTYELKADSFSISDGGGLSRGNAVSAAAITKLLAGVAKRKDASIFLDSLPISGVDGTMERRLDQEPYRKRVLGKTGYIAGVSTLSGYVLDAAGKPAFAFSILCNNVPGGDGWQAKALQENICKLLVNSLK